jgi:hypothetical protein
VLGTPSVANATGSKFIYDGVRYFGILELAQMPFWLFGFLASWLFGGEGLCYGVIIPFSSFV